MKRFLLGLFSMLLAAPCLAAEPHLWINSSEPQARKLLFIGNSFTYYNELPLLVAAFVFSANSGAHLKLGEVVQGGATLESMWQDPAAQHMLSADAPWTDVVLQEQSARPFTDYGAMIEYIRRFDEVIKKMNAHTILYQTWCDKGKPQEQKRLDDAFRDAAQRTNATVVPAGDAFLACSLEHPEINLYDLDGHHPSPQGSYLSACVFYAKLFGKQAVGLPAKLSLDRIVEEKPGTLFAIDSSVAAKLQQIADKAVADYR